MNYPRFASYCLPLVAAVLGLFVFMRLTEAEVVHQVTHVDNTTGR